MRLETELDQCHREIGNGSNPIERLEVIKELNSLLPAPRNVQSLISEKLLLREVLKSVSLIKSHRKPFGEVSNFDDKTSLELRQQLCEVYDKLRTSREHDERSRLQMLTEVEDLKTQLHSTQVDLKTMESKHRIEVTDLQA